MSGSSTDSQFVVYAEGGRTSGSFLVLPVSEALPLCLYGRTMLVQSAVQILRTKLIL